MHSFLPPSAKILSALDSTQYACTELIPLSGGFVNFIYRGTLISALPTIPPTAEIILKHAEPYVAANSAWDFAISRVHYEALMLRALNALPRTNLMDDSVTTPFFHDYLTQCDTVVLSNFAGSTQLQSYLTSHDLGEVAIHRFGLSLGQWMRRFHEWGAAPEQSSLRTKMKGNSKMAEMKYNITYGRLKEAITRFPAILQESIPVFEELAQRLETEMATGEGQLIHGDFDCRNVLISDGPLTVGSCPISLCVIDWELSRIGSIASDVGQMLSGIYLLTVFNSFQAGPKMISSFMHGYGPVTDELAFRIALDVGTQLVLWPCQQADNYDDHLIEMCVDMGHKIILHAEKQAKPWFRGGVFDSIFCFIESH